MGKRYSRLGTGRELRRRARSQSIGYCQRKVRHTTAESAEGLLFLLRFEKKERGRQRVYQCPNCGGYHVGGVRDG